MTPFVRPSGSVEGDDGRQDRGARRGRRARGSASATSLIVRAQRGGPGDVRGGHPGDPGSARGRRRRLVGGRRTTVGRIDPGPEREPDEDDELVDGVVALDVAGRVGLGVARGLRRGQDVVVGAALVGHRREDVVRRAVDDAPDAVDPVRRRARRRAARGPGMPAADGGLEAEGRPGPPGDRLELGAVMGDARACWRSRPPCRPRARPR